MSANVTGLNHITLAVADVPRSIAFYSDVLGAIPKAQWDTGAYLEMGGIWLCLAGGPVDQHKDYSHLAFSCDPADFDITTARLRATCREWRSNTSHGESLYFLDPDGHRLELHIGNLESRLAHYRTNPDKGVTVFD